MTTAHVGLTPDEVGRFFDEKGDLLGELMGGNNHFGYWHGPDDDATFAEATDRLTSHMIEMLAARPGERILDLGCGRGRPAVRLAEEVDVEIVGISVSRRDVEASTELANYHGVEDRATFRQADAMAMPFPDASFDAVWAVESMLYMPDRRHALRQVARVLRPGGRLVLSDVSGTAPATETERAALAEVLRGWAVNSLGDADEYPGLIADAGLRLTEILDVSDRTRYSRDRVMQLFMKAIEASGIPFESVDLPDELWDQSFAVFERMGYLILLAHRD